MCACRVVFQKWTTLMTAGPAALNLQVLGSLTRSHHTHMATAEGEDPKGVPLSAKAGEYQTLFSATVAALSDGECPSADKLTMALRGPAAERLHREGDGAVRREAGSGPPILCLEEESRSRASGGASAEATPQAASTAAHRGTKPPGRGEVASRGAEESDQGRPCQLFHPGIHTQILEAVGDVVKPMAKAAAEIEKGTGGHRDGDVSFPAGVTKVFKQAECQPGWARECIWDASDPADCVPMQSHDMGGEDSPQNANPDFFSEWGRRLDWPDKEMIFQVSKSGTNGHSRAAWDTVGLRDEIVSQSKWRMSNEGELYNKVKWRLTSDNSIVAEGSDSQNATTGEEALLDLNLPSILALAEAVAIVKAQSVGFGLRLDDREVERVALWAIDLSDAYRMLARISTFVLAVAKTKIEEHDRQHPYEGARAAWLDARAGTPGLERRCSSADIYIDDAFDLTHLP
ncbi:MAG: hypothetical protein SGPRY_014735 [Prymnesium sp.]